MASFVGMEKGCFQSQAAQRHWASFAWQGGSENGASLAVPHPSPTASISEMQDSAGNREAPSLSGGLWLWHDQQRF